MAKPKKVRKSHIAKKLHKAKFASKNKDTGKSFPKSTNKQERNKDTDFFEKRKSKSAHKQGKAFLGKDKSENFKTKKSSGPGKEQKKKKASRWKSKKEEEEEDSDFEVVAGVADNIGDQEDAPSDDDSYDSDSSKEAEATRKLVVQQNRKNKKSGGFQAMGLSHQVYKGIQRKGYKIPTPIQRKTIPLILDGKDLVAMARTGSGKTAAFLIPLFEKLKTHVAKAGARALILSPTRELALQTLKFTKEIGKFTGLRAAVVLGGDRMEDQFAALHENPDVIIATPGRLLHVLVEMGLKLKSIEYVVFDEADRLFEMGFQEQLHEIINRMPDTRQTLLFSATLPKLLVEFAKAGLHDPTLIRLDVETKISDQLKLSFFNCREDDKAAMVLYLLREVIDPKQQTVVFLSTKHHVEFMHLILQIDGISSTCIYSSMDQTARKINVAKFQNKKAQVMLVTDLAARGIDIPLLDNVINYNFPAKSKLFVHRVGRVARAGRTGTAYSLVSQEEVPYLIDLHIFLGRSLKVVPLGKTQADEDGLYGDIPQNLIDDTEEKLRTFREESIELLNMVRVVSNAQKKYVRSRPAPAVESIKRFKQMTNRVPGIHPIFATGENAAEDERMQLLNALKTYKGNTTIFETNATAKTSAFSVMKRKRAQDGGVIQMRHDKTLLNDDDLENVETSQKQESAEDSIIQSAFSTVIGGKKPSNKVFQSNHKKKKKEVKIRDEENYLSYKPSDFQSEMGLSVGNTFDREASSMAFDIDGDEDSAVNKIKASVRWDRKRKRFVRDNNIDPKKKKIRTESGAWISASYKSSAYKDWQNKTKMGTQEDDSDDAKTHDDDKEEDFGKIKILGKGRPGKIWHTQGQDGVKGKSKKKFKPGKGERKRPEQIMKARNIKERKMAFQKKRENERSKRRQYSMQKRGQTKR